MHSFYLLCQAIQIGSLSLRNRLVMPAMLTNFSNSQGLVNDQHLAYYQRRARGGVGLITVEPSYVHPRGRIRKEQLSLCDNSALPGLRRLAQVIHEQGAQAAVQLHHGGRNARSMVTGQQPLGASPIPTPGLEKPRQINPEELEEVIFSFAQAARLVRQAGFAALEISATTGGLLGQFLSPAANLRGDEYGGSLENRASLLKAVIKEVQDEIGSDFPIICRFNSQEDPNIKNRLTLKEGKEIARLIERAGVDAAHVYVDYDGAPQPLDQRPLKKAGLLHLAQSIKEAVNIPVIAVGRIDPLSAEKALREKKADLIAMGKALIADPDLPNKIKEGRLESVRPCIVCLRCIDNVRTDKILECTVNARAGHENEPSAVPASPTRRVLVIGGGPAGMEAARVATLRGHQVTLCEKSPRLGGLMVLGVILNPDLADLKDYLIRELRRSPVRIELNRKVTPDLLKKMDPEVLVVATGGVPARPEASSGPPEITLKLTDILGLLNGKTPPAENPVKGILWRLASWVFRYCYYPSLLRALLRLNFPVGKRLVIIGGGFAGCDLGLAYAQKGKVVTIVEDSADLLSDLGPTMKAIYLAKLKKYKVNLLKEAVVTNISSIGVYISMACSPQLLAADSVARAGELKKGGPLIHHLQDYPGRMHLIGDCNEPARIKEAIAAGHKVGCSL